MHCTRFRRIMSTNVPFKQYVFPASQANTAYQARLDPLRHCRPPKCRDIVHNGIRCVSLLKRIWNQPPSGSLMSAEIVAAART